METLQRTANRGSISTGYDIDNSLKLESDNSERVNKAAATISGAGNRRTFTISFWTKRTEINGVKQYLFEAGNSDADNDRFTLRFGTGDTFDIQSQSTWLVTSRVFRDTSAWYHFVIKVDTTDGTAADRMKLYVNGVEETSFSTDNRSSINQNHDFAVNNTEDHIIGNSQIEGSAYYNGYIAEWIQLDGTAAAPTSFGEFDEDSGIWKPKDPSALSFGTNGFYLDFEDASNLGNDASGGTDFTATNITSADQATDTPTNNFCTANVLDRTDGNSKNQEGATKITTDGGSGWCTMMATMGITKGKWYWEAQYVNNNIFVGVADSQDIYVPYSAAAKYYLGNVSNSTSVGWYFDNGQVYNGDATFAAPSADDKVMIALDWDNKAIYFGVNGTWGNSSNPESGASKTGASVYAFNNADWDNFAMPAFTVYQGNTLKINFGGYTCISISSGNSDEDGYGNFEYAPPSGYYALCSKNLAEYG